jgi:tetratricopeptide (TPR) repeat protein
MTPTDRLQGRAALRLFVASAFVCTFVALDGGAVVHAAGQRPADPGKEVATQRAEGPKADNVETTDAVLAEALGRLRASHSAASLAAVGHRYAELGLRDTAFRYFSESVAVDPSYAPAYDGEARLWRDAGYLDRALGSAHRATYFAPRSPEAWNTFGTIVQELGRHDDAANAFRRALALDSTATYAKTNLCYLALLGGRTDTAAAECQSVLALDGGFVPARNNLALAYAAAGNSALAFETFAANGDAASAHYNMGIIYLAQRDFARALHSFEAAYGADPTFDRAHERARQVRRLIQKQRGDS